jgi:hypothetical protein
MSGTFFNTHKKSNTNLKNSTENMIIQDIKMQCNCIQSIRYNKFNTAGNDPSISQKMKYASYVRTYGATQSYNAGSRNLTNIGIIPNLTNDQILYQNVINGIQKTEISPIE